jgi:hypothetical protein
MLSPAARDPYYRWGLSLPDMSDVPPAKNLSPETLVGDATALNLRDFLMSYGHAPMLLIRLPQGDTELELGLKASGPTTRAGRGGGAKPLPFRTTHQSVPSGPLVPNGARRDNPDALAQLLAEHRYFAVQVQKRDGAEALFMGRVSVGRAQNKDIVLRHSSVSKFHAWFEVEPECVYLSDAGSTNLTRVNDETIEPRTRVMVSPGAAIRFGSLETVLCSAETLWSCLNGG